MNGPQWDDPYDQTPGYDGGYGGRYGGGSNGRPSGSGRFAQIAGNIAEQGAYQGINIAGQYLSQVAYNKANSQAAQSQPYPTQQQPYSDVPAQPGYPEETHQQEAYPQGTYPEEEVYPDQETYDTQGTYCQDDLYAGQGQYAGGDGLDNDDHEVYDYDIGEEGAHEQLNEPRYANSGAHDSMDAYDDHPGDDQYDYHEGYDFANGSQPHEGLDYGDSQHYDYQTPGIVGTAAQMYT